MNGQNSRTTLVVAMLVAIPVANAYANQWSQKRLVNQLLDEEKAPQAVAEVIKQGPSIRGGESRRSGGTDARSLGSGASSDSTSNKLSTT